MSHDQRDDAELIAALNDAVPRVMALCNSPGVGVAVGRRGEVVWEEGFGYADLSAQRPFTAQTVGNSGSTGKTYTATAVMQLVERGVLGLDEPVNRHFPFEIVNPLGDRDVTVRDLLTHRSGLAEDSAGSDFAEPAPLVEDLAARYAAERSETYNGVYPKWGWKVGEYVEYSNLGIATLGLLVEQMNPEGLSFSDYVQRHIMDALGMKASSYPPAQSPSHVPAEILDRRSTGYSRLGPIHVPTPEIYFAEYPAGGAILLPSDHLRLLLAYLGGGTYDGAKILEPATVAEMLSRQVEVTEGTIAEYLGGDGHLGLVWQVTKGGKPEESFHHGGAHMWGWTNQGVAFPNLDFAMVVMTNQWSLQQDPKWAYVAEGGFLAEFVSKWLLHERPGLEREGQDRPWGWRAAYYTGLTMGDRLQGQLGMPSAIPAKDLEAMATGSLGTSADWDADGFRAGVEDIVATDGTLSGAQAFLGSDSLRVSPAELVLLHRELGGIVGDPVLPEAW